MPFISGGNAGTDVHQPDMDQVQSAFTSVFKVKNQQDLNALLEKNGIPVNQVTEAGKALPDHNTHLEKQAHFQTPDKPAIKEQPSLSNKADKPSQSTNPGNSKSPGKTVQPVKQTQPSRTIQPAKPVQQAKPAQPARNTGSNRASAAPAASQMNAFEQKVVDLTNQQRSKAGLKPLKADNRSLSRMARDKAQDMRDKNYFDHQSPTYGSPFDMMKKYGIHYSSAGENIAAGQKSPEEVVQGWMNSPGHRANILNANYTTIGVGYVQGGSYGSYWVQEFIGQ
ncbi:hypothetical protein EWI07_00465 [Sporolactobacillus sp. THM7-4]|nr:hypothetical protein EWI07_00465 [Sporolactobacillus sp. THM7-4]